MATIGDFLVRQSYSETLNISNQSTVKNLYGADINTLVDLWRTYHRDYFGGDCEVTLDVWNQVGGFFGLSFGETYLFPQSGVYIFGLDVLSTTPPPVNPEWGDLNGFVRITQEKTNNGVKEAVIYRWEWNINDWVIEGNLDNGPYIADAYSITLQTKQTQEGNGGPINPVVGVSTPQINIDLAVAVKDGMDDELFCWLFPDCCGGPGPEPSNYKPFGFIEKIEAKTTFPPWRSIIPFANYSFPIQPLKRK